MIRILIADDHAIVREGLARILEKNGEMQVVAEHGDRVGTAGYMTKWFVLNIQMETVTGGHS